MSVLSRRPLLALLASFALLALLVLPRPAHAGVLVAGATDCEDQALARPFLPWLDPASYFLVPDGSFEAGARDWALEDGAAVVAGGEPHDVSHSGALAALRLGGAGSATSPAVCVGLEHPTARLFARNTGSLLGTLRVDVKFEDAAGGVHALPVALLLGGRQWAPTLPLPLIANLLPLLPGSHTAIALRFTAQGGDWEIDDVHVDPYRKG
jgi:hypothetical protein